MVPLTARLMMKGQSSGMLSKMMPKRGFTSKMDSWIEKLLSKLPDGNVGWIIGGLNTLIYGAYLFWPKYNMHSFLNNFSFSLYGLNKGYIHNVLTCHFAHQSFLSYIIDTGIIFMIAQNATMVNGPLFVAKTVILSMFMGSFLLYLQHNSSNGMARPFMGNDAIL